MRNTGKFMIAGALALLLGAAGCADLNVTNPNEPDASRALQTAGDVQSLISGTFNTWFNGSYSYSGPSMFLSNQAFQHAAPWANAGMVFFSWIPRPAVVNDVADQFYGNFTRPWYYNYRALSAVASGLKAMNDNPGIATELGDSSTQQVKAFGRFVEGMATASLAIMYDQGFIVDETTDVSQPQTPVDYNALMDAAMGYFDDALSLATSGAAFDIPATWIPAASPLTNTQFVQLVHSMKARYMAAVARTPADRQGLNWNNIISEIDQGLPNGLTLVEDWNVGWYNEAIDYSTYPGWQEMPYWIAGMADQSGNYQTWLNTPLIDKAAIINGTDILIVTPDTRVPQGATVADQMANPGSYYKIPDPDVDDWNISSVWAHPERQQWRWSYYWASETENYTFGASFDLDEIGAAQQQLLKAEGEYYLGNLADAATIINVTRTAAGLNATDASGTNTSCVPKMPDESCGDLWEMLKWERRMESRYKGLYDAPCTSTTVAGATSSRGPSSSSRFRVRSCSC
ncbi:MAG: hypothetical protein P8Z36_05295 [Gemmatimonadota bacterium]